MSEATAAAAIPAKLFLSYARGDDHQRIKDVIHKQIDRLGDGYGWRRLERLLRMGWEGASPPRLLSVAGAK